MPADFEALFIEINIRKAKFILMATYHPPNQSDQYFFDKIGNALDRYATQYEKFLLSGDFNVQDSQHCIKFFLY